MAERKSNKAKKCIIVEICTDGDIMGQVIRMLQVLVELTHGGVSYRVVNEEVAQQEPQQEVQVNAVRHLPQELETPKARKVLDGLVSIQVLDAGYQPLGLSWSQRGYLAKWIADVLGIFHVWKVMGELWHLDSSSSRRALRSGFNKAIDLGITGDLIDKLKLVSLRF